MRKELKITRELMPKNMMCGIGACPAVFETSKGSYAVIGKVLDAKTLGLSKRVGKNEVLVEIPKALVDKKSK